MYMKKYRASQLRREWVQLFIWKFYNFQNWFGLSRRQKWASGVKYSLDQKIEGSYYYMNTKPDLCKTYQELGALFETSSGQEILRVYESAKRLINSAYPQGWQFDRKQTDLLTAEEESDVDLAISTMDDLWLVAHLEAGMLYDDNEARANISQAIADAKAYIAAQSEVSALEPSGLLASVSPAG